MRNRHFLRGSIATAAAAALLATPAASAQMGSIDNLGRPTEGSMTSVEQSSVVSMLPEKYQSMLDSAFGFFRGTGKPGVPLPDDAPRFSQFYTPTVAQNCIGGTQSAVGTAIAVPGPAALPLPGSKEGQTAFVFTALGTGKVAATQQKPMRVAWVNLFTGKRGVTTLTGNGINEEGPATITGIADTGKGLIFMTLSGAVTNTDADGKDHNCSFTSIFGHVMN